MKSVKKQNKLKIINISFELLIIFKKKIKKKFINK